MNKEQSKEVKDFIDKIINISRRYKLSISHEDYQGGFEIEPLKESNLEWLKNAADMTRITELKQ